MNVKILAAIAVLCCTIAFAAYSVVIPPIGMQTAGFFSLEEQSPEQRRANILEGIMEEINIARLEGKYKCCIEPACTMCYLGDWIFEDGTCDCDGMIANGEFDKVCPQCKKGLEEGRCISGVETEEEACALPKNTVA